MESQHNEPLSGDKSALMSSHYSSSVETLIAAMRVLSNDIQSDDGVANAAVAEAADKLERLHTALIEIRDSRFCSVTMPFTPYYDEDGITIYNADSKQVLPFLSRVDLLLTDPPYGIGVDRAMSKAGGTKYGKAAAAKRHYEGTGWDDSTPPSWFLESAKESASNAIVWGGNYYGFDASSCWLVWDKEINGEFADCELAWTNLEKPVRKFKWRWNGMIQEQMGDKKEPRVHPTQKPLALMRWCLSLVPEAKTVLDPFMGSGTTLVAARLEGRKAIGIEISEKYCEAAVKRLAQKTLF